jgi:hypothetical protein
MAEGGDSVKAPFGPGDVVVKFRNCPKAVNYFAVGTMLTVKELRFDSIFSHDGFPRFSSFMHSEGESACTCCFRLYEPPKPETIHTETKTPAKEKA